MRRASRLKKKRVDSRYIHVMYESLNAMKLLSDIVSQRLDESSRRLALFQEGKTQEEVVRLMGPRDESLPIEELREKVKFEMDSTLRSLKKCDIRRTSRK
jgi:hypothetical protein